MNLVFAIYLFKSSKIKTTHLICYIIKRCNLQKQGNVLAYVKNFLNFITEGHLARTA